MALNFPDSPTVGQIYIGGNGFTYTYVLSNGLGVWTAAPTAPLSLTSPGTISGTASAGSTLTYSTGTATGGTGPYTYAWVWKKASDNSVLQTGLTTYVIPGTLVGDRVYVTLTATDAVAATASDDTPDYPASPATIVAAVFPNLPGTLVTGPTQIPQIVSGTWADGAAPITSTGCLQISLDGTTFNQGPLTPTNGAPVYMQWAPTGATCGDAAHGTTITGTLTNGTYTNNFSLLLDRNPDPFTLSPITGQALSSTATSNSITLAGTNAPAYITYTAGTPNTLTNIKVSVGGGAYVTVPTSGTTVTVNPGQTLQFQGDVGATNNTAYTATLNVGTTTSLMSITTVVLVPTVTTPSITSPGNGTTNLNPGILSPSGLTINSSAFASVNGAGTDHASSDWELATDSGFTTVVYSATASSTYLTSWFIPTASLTVSTTYYVRVRYTSGTGGGGVVTTSSYSPGSSFGTASSFLPNIGDSYAGGYFAGQIRVFPGQDDGTLPVATTIYNLVVSPAASGQYSGAIKTSNSGSSPSATYQNEVYGKPANDADTSGTYPNFSTARSLTINGFNDWYVPAVNEMQIVYYFLKPTGSGNDTSFGSNPNAVSPQPVSTNYSGGSPGQTSVGIFQSGGSEALFTNNGFTATEYAPSPGNAVTFWPNNGRALPDQKVQSAPVRVIRRVLA